MDKEQVGFGYYPLTYDLPNVGGPALGAVNLRMWGFRPILCSPPRPMELISDLRQTRALAWAQRGPILLGRNQKRYL